ncbi:MAG: hypothetical protein JO102_05785 [Elusimicrobia bacterium]|nr:hypothetical protein [Elusimicrobiota bacterium]
MRTGDPFGVLAFLHWNHDWNNFYFDDATRRRALAQLEELGVSFVRTDILWSDVDRGIGKFDFSAYESWLPLLRHHHLEPLILLHYNKERTGPDGVRWNKPPSSFEEFAGFVSAAVRRFKSDVSHWEIWNEPNHKVYWDAPDDGLSSYCRLLKLSRQAAKAEDPSCLVLNGGLTGPVVEDVGRFYARGGKDLTDVLNIHTFVDPLSPERKQTFDRLVAGSRAVMEKHGDAAKKIWITEMGCPGIPPGRPPQTWFSGRAMSEQQQADFLDEQYDWLADHPYVEKLFWAFHRDTDGEFNDATDHFGLVRFDLTPKPSFARYADRIRAYRARGTKVFEK